MEREYIKRHLQAAKHWLSEAEKWLGENNLVRTFSNVILAIAELESPLRAHFQKKEKEIKEVKKQVAWLKPAYGLAATILLIFMTAQALRILRAPQKTASPGNPPFAQKATPPDTSKPLVIVPEKKEVAQAQAKIAPKITRKAKKWAGKRKPAHFRKKQELSSEKELTRATGLALEEKPASGNVTPHAGKHEAKEKTDLARSEKQNFDVLDLMFTAESALKGKAE